MAMSTEMTIVAVIKMIYLKILQHLPKKNVFFFLIKIGLKLLLFLSFPRNLSEQENKKKKRLFGLVRSKEYHGEETSNKKLTDLIIE